ncbi:hypothetical protein B0H14DRAFT_3150895 [Mycena olivaceomarginata]|nr:hypothetical protein B0H14DRAFT_3150895 [Mycena olivaceomarginata]
MVGPVVSSLMAHDPALEGDELGSGYGMAAGRPPTPPLMVNHQPHRRTRLRKPEVRNATYGVGAKYTMSCRIRVEQRSNWGGNKPGEERVRGWVVKDGGIRGSRERNNNEEGTSPSHAGMFYAMLLASSV